MRVFDHFEKSSSPLLDTKSCIAAKKATITAITNKKPARTKNILKSKFCTHLPSSDELRIL
jgi:hypothetical protein